VCRETADGTVSARHETADGTRSVPATFRQPKMDWQPEQPDAEQDVLDRLLAEARWEEPAPEVLHRLQNQWRFLMAGRVRRRRQRMALVAAGIFLAIGLTFWARGTVPIFVLAKMGLSPSSTQRGAGGEGIKQGPVASGQRTERKNHQISKSQNLKSPNLQIIKSPNLQIGMASPHPSPLPKGEGTATKARAREPNPYELLVLAAHRRTIAAQRDMDNVESEPAKTSEDTTRSTKPVESADGPEAVKGTDPFSPTTAGQWSTRKSGQSLDKLFQGIRSKDVSQRIASAQALGRLDQPEVSRTLITMAVRGVNRQEALIALLSSSEPTARQFTAEAERNPSLSPALWNAKRQSQTFFPRSS
jgi:hypothetical protein